MLVPVTALYAALLAIVGLVLAGMVGNLRSKTQVSLGDGGKPELLEAMRRHANFVEYVPLFLVLLAIAELNKTERWWLHALGAIMLAGRLAHPLGIDHTSIAKTPRIIGAAGTVIATAATVATLLWQVLRG